MVEDSRQLRRRSTTPEQERLASRRLPQAGRRSIPRPDSGAGWCVSRRPKHAASPTAIHLPPLPRAKTSGDVQPKHVALGR